MTFREQRKGNGSTSEPRNRPGRRATHNDDDGGEAGGWVNVPPRGRRDPPPLTRRNFRWSDLEDDRSSNSGRDGQRGGNQGRGWTGYISRRHRNKRGYYGDLRPNKQRELELFGNFNDKETTGINFEKYDSISVKASGACVPPPIEAYSSKTIGRDLFRNVELCGYTKPTPIQKYSVPVGAAGRDLMACAQTGSGKTAGFLFPIIKMMIAKGGSPPCSANRRRLRCPEALILAPTRELAAQIHAEAQKFTYCTGIAPAVVYGGADVRIEQLRGIELGCDLLVATPGRLIDLIERGRLAMHNVKFLVLDEADRMLDMGFEPQIRRIVEQEGMPTSETRQTMMFSATFPTDIQLLASDFLSDYIFLAVGRVGSPSEDVDQQVEYVEERDKIETLMRFLLTIDEGLILVFVNTKRSCDRVASALCCREFPACSIHGDKTQGERQSALSSFKSGDTPVMVATDVASRGLDISGVNQVVNFDLPTNMDAYIHRIGRTGRAGNPGNALSFVNERDQAVVRDLCGLLEKSEAGAPEWLRLMCTRKNYERRPPQQRGKLTRNEPNFGGADHRATNQRMRAPSIGSGAASDTYRWLHRNDLWACIERAGQGKTRTGKKNHQSQTHAAKPESLSVASLRDPLLASPLLALPRENDAEAAARIERKNRTAEEKLAAKKKAEEEAAAAKAGSERRAAKNATQAAKEEARILDRFTSGERQGSALALWCARQGTALPTVGRLVSRVLLPAVGEQKIDHDCAWAAPSRYGEALVSLVENDLAGRMQVLWAIQAYCCDLGFPRIDGHGEYLVQSMFRAMYKYDLADEEAFTQWRDDESPHHEAGKTDAIIQTVDWFDWLLAEDSEEDSPGYEEEEKKEEDWSWCHQPPACGSGTKAQRSLKLVRS